jgi:hypothetical protein
MDKIFSSCVGPVSFRDIFFGSQACTPRCTTRPPNSPHCGAPPSALR